MQLILDAHDNIDIERNMATIEQEPLNEKLLSNKVIEHLSDDITSGNKENIQKQNNILDVDKVTAIDTDKDLTTRSDEVLNINLNEEKVTEDTPTQETTDNKKTIELNEKKHEIIQNVKAPPGQVNDDPVTENSCEKESHVVEHETKDEVKSEDGTKTKLEETNDETDQYNSAVYISMTQKEVVTAESSTELNEEAKVVLDQDVAKSEKTTIDKEVSEIDIDKELDISELSTELNEEKEMDLDREFDTAMEVNSEKIVEVKECVNTPADDELSNQSNHNEVPKTDLKDKTDVGRPCELGLKNFAIEIDDDDEKVNESESIVEPDSNIHVIVETTNEKSTTELNQEKKSTQDKTIDKEQLDEQSQPKRICRLSNNLDIFSDEEEDDNPNTETPADKVPSSTVKQCINIDDDDDIMLIDEDSSAKDCKTKDTSVEVDSTTVIENVEPVPADNTKKDEIVPCVESKPDTEIVEETVLGQKDKDVKDVTEPVKETTDVAAIEKNKAGVENSEQTEKNKKPLLPKNFVKSCKKNLADMTRDDLEDFCILKIVESIVDRSNLGEIKKQLKNLTQTMEECKKKCLMLSKQNKDLQVVLKSVQEEQKSGSDVHITPLKITRSVGMQVVMVTDKNHQLRKSVNGNSVQQGVPTYNPSTKQIKLQPVPNTRNQKEKTTTQPIPVPRLVPATPPAAKTNAAIPNNTVPKPANTANNTLQNGVKAPTTVPKSAEKRGRSLAVTVDLTDDEPPAKLPNTQRGPVNQPMRVLTAAPNLIPSPRFAQNINSPRKVYIPISGPQAQNVRPGQTIMLKTLSSLGPRPRVQTPQQMAKAPQAIAPVRYGRGQVNRHPAPLPDAIKQYHSPNWKSLPPAPDLKLSKVENGIVISWKIDGYQEDNHEEIASYQLYAYQETSSHPNTALWKKIGDVKALPLPMACTLTQFMVGYKYYFAVRAVDVRSRFGPFSLPGSIVLINKM